MVWPCIFIFIAGVVFFYIETRRRGLAFCGDGQLKRKPPDGAEDGALTASDTMMRWKRGSEEAECQLIKSSESEPINRISTEQAGSSKNGCIAISNDNRNHHYGGGLGGQGTDSKAHKTVDDNKALLKHTGNQIEIIIDSPRESLSGSQILENNETPL